MKKYSIIVPHYNDFERIRRLLRSIPIQRRDLEVIIVDDCSASLDDFVKLREDWGNVTFLRQSTNRGAGAARNLGLAHAVGKYVLFADSDDEFVTGAFDALDQYLREEDLVYFLATAVQERSEIPSVRAIDYNDLVLNYLQEPSIENLHKLKAKHCVPWAKVYSKSYLDAIDIKFDETYVSNDVYFNVVAAIRAGTVNVVDEVIYRVYRSSGSLTSTRTSEHFIERVRVAENLAKQLRNLRFPERVPATGFILESLGYGLATFFKVLRICVRSDMEINLLRALNPLRWIRFYNRRRIKDREIRSNQ